MLSSGAELNVTETLRASLDTTPTLTANIIPPHLSIRLLVCPCFSYVVKTSPKSEQKARFQTRVESDGQKLEWNRESLKRSSALSFPSLTQIERKIL